MLGISQVFVEKFSVLVFLGLVSATVFITVRFLQRRSHPLPPGPRGLPLIGNLLDLPKGLEGPHWAKHRNIYGTPVRS